MGVADKAWRALLEPMLARLGHEPQALVAIEPLTGGVSSDIVRLDFSDGPSLCAKRALPTLKVASVWEAPVERNHFEAQWLRLAGKIVPGVAPAVLAEDEARGVVILDYLAPEDFSVWKADLLAGRLDPRVPPLLASALARIHAATWRNVPIAESFATDAMFDALRLDPYLRTLAQRTPDLATPILAVLEATARTHLALVHGDVSPKNILVSRHDAHPVLLDAECAWYGDPAFDAAFCLNHLLLKAVHMPALRQDLFAGVENFFTAWIAGLPAPERATTEGRLAHLLPCLFLARVDGKSPVEYLDETGRAGVRAMAKPLIADPPATLRALLDRLNRGPTL